MSRNMHQIATVLRPAIFKCALVGLAAFALTAAGGCTFMNTPTAKGPKYATATHMTASPISVQSRNGSVEVIADPSRSDVEISGTFQCAGATQQEADQRLAQAKIDVSRDTSHALLIQPNFPGGAEDNDGASLVIRIPDANGVTINTSNGSVTVKALRGALVIDTSNASVNVGDYDGAADIKSSNGAIIVRNLTGDLKADTSNAKVDASGINGRVAIDTSNGSITLALAPGATGPITLDSSNASITVQVGSAFPGEMSLDTSNGSVAITGEGVNIVQNGKQDAVLQFGSGGERSTVETSNGRITVTVIK